MGGVLDLAFPPFLFILAVNPIHIVSTRKKGYVGMVYNVL